MQAGAVSFPCLMRLHSSSSIALNALSSEEKILIKFIMKDLHGSLDVLKSPC